jgi:hypothetical protein
MQSHPLIHILTQNAERIRTLAEAVTEDQARWKPTTGDWSILETITHLHDEEMEDFRVRLDITLHQPDQEYPPIDPAGWVTERRYNERHLQESLQGFLDERRASLIWLQSLENPDWEKVFTASWGKIRAGDLFASWAAHDLIHLRQLVELHYAYTRHAAAPYEMGYAGDW